MSGYEITREIGVGAFASVYEAVQESVGRRVALKVLSAVAADADMERRFRAECRAVGELSWHPHVVGLFEAGISDEGRPYMAMELMPGGSLSDQIEAHGPLEPREVTRVGVEIADALEAAHEVGVVHRDVKPGNILIGRRGEYRLGDFGIATISDVTKSATGSFSGTVAYCAPEVLRGERAGPQADLFSLGATLYALITGRSAFATGTGDALGAIVHRVISEPAPRLPHSTPPYLVTAIERSMSKDPGARYDSARELGDGLATGAAATLVDEGVDPLPVPEPEGRAEPERDPTPTQPRPLPPASPPSRAESPRQMPRPSATTLLVDEAQVIAVEPVGQPRGSRRRVGIVAMVAIAVAACVMGVALARFASSRTGPGVAVSVEVGPSPTGIAFGDGAIWVTNADDATVSRIDPVSNVVTDTIDVGIGPRGITFGAGAVWVTSQHDGGTVYRIDPAANSVTDRIDVGGTPRGIAFGDGAVWVVADLDGGWVSRIDPAANAVTDRIDVGRSPSGITFGDGAVWVTDLQDAVGVSRIDGTTVTDTIVVGRRPSGVTFGDGAVWVANSGDGTVSRIDPTLNQNTDTIGVGLDPGGITFDDGAVDTGALWVTNSGDGTVSRIHPIANEVTDTIGVGSEPKGIASGGGALWVANSGDDTVSRISP